MKFHILFDTEHVCLPSGTLPCKSHYSQSKSIALLNLCKTWNLRTPDKFLPAVHPQAGTVCEETWEDLKKTCGGRVGVGVSSPLRLQGVMALLIVVNGLTFGLEADGYTWKLDSNILFTYIKDARHSSCGVCEFFSI